MMKRLISLTDRGLGAAFMFYAASAPAYASGMPQLEFSNPLVIWQVIWGAGIFLVFYLILSRFMLPRVGRILSERTAYITSEAEKAREAKVAADRALAEQEASLENARKTAKAHMQDLLGREHEESERIKEGATSRMKEEIAAAEERIEEEKKKALVDIRDVATGVTQEIVYHFTGVRSSQDAIMAEVSAAHDGTLSRG